MLAEALETWEVSIFAQLFPRILEIVTEIDRRFRLELEAGGWHPSKIDYMAPLRDGRVHMAWWSREEITVLKATQFSFWCVRAPEPPASLWPTPDSSFVGQTHLTYRASFRNVL